MGRYQLRGTPSTLLVDRAGRLRRSFFGALSDLALGVHLGQLLAEAPPGPASAAPAPAPAGVCRPGTDCT